MIVLDKGIRAAARPGPGERRWAGSENARTQERNLSHLKSCCQAGGTAGEPDRIKQYVNKQVSHYIGCAVSVDKLLGGLSLKGTTKTGLKRSLPHYRVGFEFANNASYVDVPQRGDMTRGPGRIHPNCGQQILDFHRPTRRDLDHAKKRLDRFSVVLPLDRLSEAGALFAAKFDYTNLALFKTFNYQKHSKPELDVLETLEGSNPLLLTAMRRNTNLDRDLHMYAGQLFDAALEAVRNKWSGAVAVRPDRSRTDAYAPEIGGASSVKVHPAANRIEPPPDPHATAAAPPPPPRTPDATFGTAISV